MATWLARVKENVRPSPEGDNALGLGGDPLQGSGGGGPHGCDGPSLRFGLGNDASRLGRDFAVLPMHGMLADIVAANRAEGAIAHIQGHFSPGEPSLLEGGPHFRGEM